MTDLFADDDTASPDLVQRYLHLTRTVMPALAREPSCDWPVKNDHCFQRIILDTLCGGVWYRHIKRPAYKHLSADRARGAVTLCEDIIAGRVDLAQLNRQSLLWRRGDRQPPAMPPCKDKALR